MNCSTTIMRVSLVLGCASLACAIRVDSSTRRTLLRRTAGAFAAAAVAPPASAAGMAAPALVPSPFKPSGDMAKTCEVVALGREDVCLQPKSMLGAFDKMKLDKALDEMSSALESADETQRAKLVKAQTLVRAVTTADWDACARALADSPDLLGASAKPLKVACRERDVPAGARALIKLTDGL